MSVSWDFTVSKDGKLVLAVEVKNRLNTSPEWATQFRRNIFAHGTFPYAPYFLMIFPDRIYLWKSARPDIDDIQPDYTIDARPILTPYFEQVGVTKEQISGTGLELIVASWLSNVVHANIEPTDVAPNQRWIVESGLYDAVKGGYLGQEVAA